MKNEIAPSSEAYSIYATILPKKEACTFCSWLYPISMAENDEDTLQEGSVLDTVFIEADFLQIKNLINSNQKFKGTVTTESGDTSIEVQLKHSDRLNSVVKELYSHFINNAIPWTTLNIPYLGKFFDIKIVQYDEGQDISFDSIKTWNVSFGKYEKYIRKEMTLVWNVKEFLVESAAFPLPVEDKKVFEYEYDIP